MKVKKRPAPRQCRGAGRFWIGDPRKYRTDLSGGDFPRFESGGKRRVGRNGKNGQLGSFFTDYSMYTQDSVVNNSVPLELTEIVLTDADRIGTNAFLGCKMLQSISINDGVESIGTGAFQGCKGLSTIVIPDSVVTIGSAVFKECDNLETVFLSSNITSIEKESFIGCTKLRGVNSETAFRYHWTIFRLM